MLGDLCEKEKLMVAPRSLVWGGLGEGRACLEAQQRSRAQERLGSHVAFGAHQP